MNRTRAFTTHKNSVEIIFFSLLVKYQRKFMLINNIRDYFVHVLSWDFSFVANVLEEL